MNLSNETEAVLAYLDAVTENNLRKRSDLGAVLEIGFQLGVAEKCNDLIFSGKCVWNVYAALRKATPNNEGYKQLEQEFASVIKNFREMLLFFVANSPQVVMERFEQTYLGVGQGVLRNVVDFTHDLARLKDVQNEGKHSKD